MMRGQNSLKCLLTSDLGIKKAPKAVPDTFEVSTYCGSLSAEVSIGAILELSLSGDKINSKLLIFQRILLNIS